MNNLGNIHIVPVLSPADSTTTVTEVMTYAINSGLATEVQFLVQMGVITGDTLVVKAYKDANSTTSSGGVAVAFRYKLTDVSGTDATSAWTACASTGLTIQASDDNKCLLVDLDIDANDAYPYVYLGIDPGASMTNFVRGAIALVVPRYNQSIPASFTA